MYLRPGIIQGFIHLFYPRLCEGCSAPLAATEEVVCLACHLQFPRTGYHEMPDNETALKFAGRFPFQYATSLAYFTNEGLLQDLLHGLKYKGKKQIGRYFGGELGRELQQTAWAQTIDLIMPVPLHPKKIRKRGYNQSMVIAQEMGVILNIACDDTILIRTRDTSTQTRKTREERADNMNNAFAIQQGKDITGLHVLIVDDVLTTGATLEACAKTILGIPGTKISVATIGIVP